MVIKLGSECQNACSVSKSLPTTHPGPLVEEQPATSWVEVVQVAAEPVAVGRTPGQELLRELEAELEAKAAEGAVRPGTPDQRGQGALRRLELEQTEGHVAARAAAGHEVLGTPGQPGQELKLRMEVEGPAAARAAAGPRYLVVHGQQDPELLLHGLELESTRRPVAVVAALKGAARLGISFHGFVALKTVSKLCGSTSWRGAVLSLLVMSMSWSR